MKYYITATSSRSVNAIRDGGDDITTYTLETIDPTENKYFDRCIDTSESIVHEFDAETDEKAVGIFNDYMAENYDISNQGKTDSDYGYDCAGEPIKPLAQMTLGKGVIDNEFYTIEDPDGVTESGNIWPEAKEGVEILWGLDTGTYTTVNHCAWFDDFMKIPELNGYLKTLADIDYEKNIDWKSIDMGTNELEQIVDILNRNGYETNDCVSPGHLDSSSPSGCGQGVIYSYIFIKKA